MPTMPPIAISDGDIAESILRDLLEIARAFTQERSIERLLGLILEKSLAITQADAGSIYVVEPASETGGERKLRFKLSINESIRFESQEFSMPVSMRSIAGAVVLTGHAISLPDVYEIPEVVPYRFDRTFDQRAGYRTKSMLAMPLWAADGEVIGVIQLINKKRRAEVKLSSLEQVTRYVVPFDDRSEAHLQMLSVQAGVALENAMLYDEVRSIFDGFVRASVQAIEARDPTTSGHSVRVADFSVKLAQEVHKVDIGPFKDMAFAPRDYVELEYASLLHDFGKIGVREEVLIKAKKLYPYQLDAVRLRAGVIKRDIEVRSLRAAMEALRKGDAALAMTLEEEGRSELVKIEAAIATISKANEPTVLEEGDFQKLSELLKFQYLDFEGKERPLLTEREILALQVTRGSLHPDEVTEIRSHVTHTIDFLSRIPWGRSLCRVPEIAGAHHERLNGTGYPLGLRESSIPLPSRIMSVADIYDALTARDRPYKRALPSDRAFSILEQEVSSGHVDGELVRLFRAVAEAAEAHRENL